jgi:hypothetical protein
VTAASDGDADLRVGDRVFVYPNDRDAPVHLRGFEGMIVALDGPRAEVHGSDDDELVLVDVSLLHRDRRHKRRWIDWDALRENSKHRLSRPEASARTSPFGGEARAELEVEEAPPVRNRLQDGGEVVGRP